MTEYCIRYSLATGSELARFHGPEGVAKLQFVGESEGIIIVPAASFQLPLAEIPASEIRDVLWRQIKDRRSAVIDGGAPTPFGAVDSCETEDVPARTNIMGAVLAAVIAKMTGAPFAKSWTMLDNSVQSFDADQMIAVGLAVLAHVNAAHDRARELRAAIDAAEDAATLLQIDIASGWPSL